MNTPEFGGNSASESAIDEFAFEDLLTDNSTQDVLSQLVREERDRRAAAFEQAHGVLSKYKREFQENDTYHKTYTEPHGLPIVRRAVVQAFSFPGVGKITRLIVNDEGGDHQNVDELTLTTQDMMISPFAKAFSYQSTTIRRSKYTGSWGDLAPSAGPLLQQRHDHISIVNGNEYGPLLPRVGGGYQLNICESRQLRQRLGEFTSIIGSLSVSTYEPGFTVKDYF